MFDIQNQAIKATIIISTLPIELFSFVYAIQHQQDEKPIVMVIALSIVLIFIRIAIMTFVLN